MGRGPTESLRALGADADKDINLSVNVRWGLDGCLLGKLALTRGRVPLSVIRVGINESRFATRAWACGERVRYPTIFPKSLIRYLMNEG